MDSTTIYPMDSTTIYPMDSTTIYPMDSTIYSPGNPGTRNTIWLARVTGRWSWWIHPPEWA
jgi:hypothetical protein